MRREGLGEGGFIAWNILYKPEYLMEKDIYGYVEVHNIYGL